MGGSLQLVRLIPRRAIRVLLAAKAERQKEALNYYCEAQTIRKRHCRELRLDRVAHLLSQHGRAPADGDKAKHGDWASRAR
jgi:hypothetical protein